MIHTHGDWVEHNGEANEVCAPLDTAKAADEDVMSHIHEPSPNMKENAGEPGGGGASANCDSWSELACGHHHVNSKESARADWAETCNDEHESKGDLAAHNTVIDNVPPPRNINTRNKEGDHSHVDCGVHCKVDLSHKAISNGHASIDK